MLCQKKIHSQKGKILCTDNIEEGVKNVDFIYTDTWVSMGESQDIWHKRINILRNYQVNHAMLNSTNNPQVKILHCLPALHDKTTKIGQSILKQYGFHNGMEITDDIFQKHQKIIFEQAENRLHTIKAILVSSLSKNKFLQHTSDL